MSNSITLFEIVCRDCGAINRNETPIPSKEDGLDLYCYGCNSILVTFYSNENIMGKAIRQHLDDKKTPKGIHSDSK